MKNVTAQTYASTDYITIAEVKSHLRLTSTDDDAYLATLLNACFDYVSNVVGYEVRKSTVDYFFTQSDCGSFHIPARIMSLTSVKYRDAAGDLQTVDPADYDQVLTISANYGYDVTLINAPSSLYDYGWKYKITVVEGFGKTGDSVDTSKIFPDAIRQAIYLLCEHYYTQRGAVSVGVSAMELPLGIENLLSNYSIKEFI